MALVRHAIRGEDWVSHEVAVECHVAQLICGAK
jgi:hypothetical protein